MSPLVPLFVALALAAGPVKRPARPAKPPVPTRKAAPRKADPPADRRTTPLPSQNALAVDQDPGVTRPPAPLHAAKGGAGAVTFATATRAYLDVGRAEGLGEGATVKLLRGGRGAGTCRVEKASEHSAVCAGGGLKAGDSLALARVAAPAPPPAKVLVKTSEDERQRRRAALDQAQPELVGFKGAAHPAGAMSAAAVEASLTHASFVSTDAGPWHEERLDLALRGVEVAEGYRLYALATARQWVVRPDSARFRPGANSQLYVREAELVRRPASGFTLAAGRVWPLGVPGVAAFDGAQAGWRTAGGQELGVFAGAMPDAVTLAPTFDRATAGGYWSLAGSDAGPFGFLHHEGRLAAVLGAGASRLEANALTMASVAKELDLALELAFGLGAQQAPALVDGARLDLSYRPAEALSLQTGVRYLGRPALVFGDDPAAQLSGGQAVHGDLSARWRVARPLELGLTGGVGEDLEASRARGWAGPELSLPRPMALPLVLSTGYLEEWGWYAGRSAFAQVAAQPVERLSVTGRLSWFEESRGAAAGTDDELGAFASVKVAVASWLDVRVSGLGRVSVSSGLGGEESASAPPMTGWVTAGLGGRY